MSTHLNSPLVVSSLRLSRIVTEAWHRLPGETAHDLPVPRCPGTAQQPGAILRRAAVNHRDFKRGKIWRFPEMRVPLVIIHFRLGPCKPSIFGYPHLWKPPFDDILLIYDDISNAITPVVVLGCAANDQNIGPRVFAFRV